MNRYTYTRDELTMEIRDATSAGSHAAVGIKAHQRSLRDSLVILVELEERRRAAQALAGDEWRVVSANTQVFGTQPPSPKMLREAANILETEPYQRTKTAAWLREIAAAIEPEPDAEQVLKLTKVMADFREWHRQNPVALTSREVAEWLASRGVRVGERR